MHYPTFAEYCDALRLNLGVVLSDPVLGRGTLRMHAPGLPVTHSGNFALTFEVVADGRKYAVRCFHKPSDALRVRYDAIAAHLRTLHSPYFVDFEFQPAGITTESGAYPIVRMDWAEGPTLAAYVAEHRRDAEALGQLRASLRELARHLREAGIAHGDIQPGNLVVQDDARLRLIDYDGMFVPQLARLRSAELGQRNFQHPGRRAWHFDAGLDAFAFSLLDLVLDALARQPELWDQSASNADAFILRAPDLAHPSSSPVLRRLAAVPGLEMRAKHLAAICVSSFDRIPALEDFLADRNIPPVSVVFTGDAHLRSSRDDAWHDDVVDAANFARCCARVGDRVELIGAVVRVTQAASCLRVEFAEPTHDMVCLKIWPDALARLEQVPDATWVGKWVSAVGLVDPVYSAGSGAHRQKDVAISITEPFQLRRITADEAGRLLRQEHGRTIPVAGPAAGVGTDRIGTQPIHEPAALPSPPAGRALEQAGRARSLVRRTAWVACAVLAVLVVASIWIARSPRPATPAPRRPAAQAPAATPVVRPAPAEVPARLVTQHSLSTGADPLETIAGPLQIAAVSDAPDARILLLDGQPLPGIHHDSIELSHRAVYSDREIIVGYTQCRADEPACRRAQPFWIELRAGVPPRLWRTAEPLASDGSGAVTASDSGVRIEFGVWDGERRAVTLTAAPALVVTRRLEPRRPLGAGDCALVRGVAEACATGSDCRTYAASARPIALPQWAQLSRLYHESTGFDAAAFRALCVSSCQLGLTPSRDFIRRNVCSGAPAGQWPSADPAAGWID